MTRENKKHTHKPKMYVLHRHKHPLHLNNTPPYIVYSSTLCPQSSSLHHRDMEDEMWVNTIPYLTSWLSAPSCCGSLPDCILILRLPQAEGQAGSNKHNNQNCSKMTLCLGQWGWGDNWKTKTKMLLWSCWVTRKLEKNYIRRRRNERKGWRSRAEVVMGSGRGPDVPNYEYLFRLLSCWSGQLG